MKRTPAQLEFDLIKKGWAFCNREMLAGKIERLEELASALPPSDPRHKMLAHIKDYAKKFTARS
jgi:hypothetical protein